MKPIYRRIQPSVTMGLDTQAKALAAAGRDVINLTAGQVDLPMPEGPLKAIASPSSSTHAACRDT